MQRTTLIPAALAAVLLLAGCGGTGGTTTPSSAASADAGGAATEDAGGAAADGGSSGLSAAEVAKDACSVLSAEEASAAAGGGITDSQGEGGACAYSGSGNGIIVTYVSGGDSMWDILHTDGTPAVSGIGERAEGSGGSVLFQKGTFVVDVSQAGDDASAADRVTGIAKAIAEKL